MIRFSVIVPVYNSEKYLEECLASILQQDYKNFEVIVVDDGSTDASPNICKRISEKDSRVKVFQKKNGGVTSARKYALTHISGEYVVFVDSDDTISNGFFDSGNEIISNCHPDMIYYCDKTFYALQEGLYANNALNFLKNCYVHDPGRKGLNYGAVSFSLCNKIIRSNIFKNAQFLIRDDVILGEDLICVGLCLLCVNSLFVSNQYYYNYRRNPNSATRYFSEKYFQRYNETVLEMHRTNFVSLDSINCFGFSVFYNAITKLAINCERYSSFKNKILELKQYNYLWDCVRNVKLKHNIKSLFKVTLLRRNMFIIIYYAAKRLK